MSTGAHAARQRILETARELFYQEGIHAVGIDTIIERSGVAKATLYYHFASKEALIEAYLQERDRAFWVWFERAISGEQEAKGKLLAFFDALIVRVSAPGYRGCGFLNCAAEFPHEGRVGHMLPRATKHKLRWRLRELTHELQIDQPDALADQLVLLAEGSFASSPLFDAPGPAMQAREAARILIDAATRTASQSP